MDISRRSLLAFSSAAAAVGMLSACSAERETATTAAATDAGTEPASTESAATGGELIGIAMPTKSLERWNRDGSHLVELLTAAGFKTSLQYADNKQDQQNNQLQNMLNDGAKVLVIASIDGTALGPVLDQAKSQGATVIAYDRLINGSENVNYYATFDNYKVGQLQGQFILDNIDQYKGADGSINLEPFAGSPDDNNAKFFFSGAWDKIGEKVTSGEFTVPSGKAPKSNEEWQSIGIPGWESAKAQAEMENRLNSFYSGKKVNIVLSPNDSLALGIQQALDGAGYKVGTDWPLLTGQDADLANTKAMLEGKQSMTVWKDTRKLGEQVAKMVEQIIKGEEVEVNDTETYDNGKLVVPTYLVEPEVVTKDTVKTALVDSGFYKAEDLGL
ncbi:substrate-binding domain-containing protein [Tessaracoccus flavescens]|uniref:ABC transporter substrate-binding protein n=1 Tax=Tessaracoccus flavescens TaxID=399497 RepID=A0A1Q2CX09_9ACTN|nr:sugar-binding protein [Tessaracoccus flavescens]AQP50623.1 ABC transporter substrate-binding protein [Tessaracoccus flavescens]